MGGQCDLLVDAVTDYALVLPVILESDILDLQVGADYLIVLPANRNARYSLDFCYMWEEERRRKSKLGRPL